VVITGAAQRTGRTLALRFAADGRQVGLYRRSSRKEADPTARGDCKIRGTAAVLPADLADAGQVASLVPSCATALGAPHVS